MPTQVLAKTELEVAAGPHITGTLTTRRVMTDVLVGLLPAVVAAGVVFRSAALVLLVSCLVAATATEAIFNIVRKQPLSILDGSAAITAVILALSLPPGLPWWAAAVGTVVAIAIGKMVFGGLGANIFNPAMVGRAFLMAAFPVLMTTWTAPKVATSARIDAVTQATPLGVVKFGYHDAETAEKHGELAKFEKRRELLVGQRNVLLDLTLGRTGGSLGETSALALLIGGIYLLIRRTTCYRIPLAVLATVFLTTALAHLLSPDRFASPLVQLSSGGLMLGAFFIATDPVTSPLSKNGRWIFGIGVGLLTVLIRLFGNYPEGVMFAVLLMNSVSPLIDRFTAPTPVGGKSVAG